MAFMDRGGTEQASRKIIRDSMNAPLLTREHELQLARAWRNDGDEAALH